MSGGGEGHGAGRGGVRTLNPSFLHWEKKDDI